jgi:hypothetical protein
VFVFMNDLGWNFAIDDSLENGFSAHRHFSMKKDWSAVVGCDDYPARRNVPRSSVRMGRCRIPLRSPKLARIGCPPRSFAAMAVAPVMLAIVSVCGAGSVACARRLRRAKRSAVPGTAICRASSRRELAVGRAAGSRLSRRVRDDVPRRSTDNPSSGCGR